MLRVGSWLYGKRPANASTQSLDSLTELKDLDDALKAATLIMNDDVDGAEEGLAKGASSFHNLGRGVVAFIRATLGFEQDIMRQASERLSEAETSAAGDQQRAQHNSHAPNSFHSKMHAPGTEYALCQAIAQLMGAVVGVLNESLTESIKAFYKLRKAYITLDAILKMEEKFMELRGPVLVAQSIDRSTPSEATTGTKSSVTSSLSSATKTTPASDNVTPEDKTDISPRLSGLALSHEHASSDVSTGTSTSSAANIINHDPDSDIFQNEIDAFVHSGANFCFGILLLLISMVPPAFSKLLSIIGFRGDKQRGLRMLWQASKFHNLVGAMASLALLGYYNGFVRYCDIMPDSTPGDDGGEAYPRERLAALLAEMRSRFPNSQLWVLEESRMKGANKDLEGALELLCADRKSTFQQVNGLRVFEKSLNSLFVHKYEQCAESFLDCVQLNSWSHSLYYYIAGSCHVVLYRESLSNSTRAEKHAKKAAEYLRMAPTFAGRKRFMARQLPFDIFVTRKLAKWEARAKEWNIRLVDAIGVDPVEEMIFFWNGYNRMTPEQLKESLSRLAWCESEANMTWPREGPEEKAALELLRAAVHRSLRNHDEAKKVLQTRVLSQDKSVFKGNLKDDWVLPAAHFEVAANLWMERPEYLASHGSSSAKILDRSPTSQADLEKKKVRECKEWLDRAARWESYELDTRIGLKVTAALEAVHKWESMHPV